VAKGKTVGFFSGPSKQVTFRMAQGVASFAMQIYMLSTLDEHMREEIVRGMRAEGAPTTIDELTVAAGQVIREQQMGWVRKGQFLGVIQGELLNAGMSASDAKYLIGLIEIRSGSAKVNSSLNRPS